MSEHGDDPAQQACVVVAVGINPHNQRLLEAAARLAHGLAATFFAVHIHLPGAQARLYRSNLEWQFEQAQTRGAITQEIEGQDVASALVAYAWRYNATHIVIGQSDVSRWHEIRYGTITNRLLREIARQQARIDLYIVTSTSRT